MRLNICKVTFAITTVEFNDKKAYSTLVEPEGTQNLKVKLNQKQEILQQVAQGFA